MIVVPVEHGSPEWIAARIGMPTASQFHRIVTPKNLQPSKASETYLCELVAERILGCALDDHTSEWMERGVILEEQAVSYYELQQGQDTTAVGFITNDEGTIGCSPDRLVGDAGGLEIKCPSPAVHVANLLGDLTEKHRMQVQGGLWLTGRKWWDLLSFHPDMPPALVRVERDEAVIEALSKAVPVFAERVDIAHTALADDAS